MNIFCLFPKISMGGGGKTRAIFKRLNNYSLLSEHSAIVLTVDQSIEQKQIFRKLQNDENVASGVLHYSLFEAAGIFCDKNILAEHDELSSEWKNLTTCAEPFDHSTIEYLGDESLGTYNEIFYQKQKRVLIRSYFNHQILSEVYKKKGERKTYYSYYSLGELIGGEIKEGQRFICGYNLLNQTKYKYLHNFHRSFLNLVTNVESVMFVDGITVAYLANQLKTPKILYLHADHRLMEQPIPRIKRFLENFDCDLIITATQRQRKLLYQDFELKSPILVVPHSLDQATPIPVKERGNIVTVSRLDLEGKPIHEAIKAFAKVMHLMPDVNYQIFGAGAGAKTLKNLIQELGCGDRIKLMGYTNQPDTIFANALFSIYLTLTEGFGLALLESLAQGCPVISYDVDYGPRELIKDGVNGKLVRPNDIEQLSAAILDCHKKLVEYQQNTSLGLDVYSCDKYTKNMEDVPYLAQTLYFARHGNNDVSEYQLGIFQRVKEKLLALYKNSCIQNQNVEFLQGYMAALTLYDQKEELLEVLITLLDRDPNNLIYLKRVVWVTSKLNGLYACAPALAQMKDQFPKDYNDFLEKFPKFRSVLD